MSYLRREGETSHALTEIRTVLTRARTSRHHISNIRFSFPDDDADEMVADLDKVIDILAKWARK